MRETLSKWILLWCLLWSCVEELFSSISCRWLLCATLVICNEMVHWCITLTNTIYPIYQATWKVGELHTISERLYQLESIFLYFVNCRAAYMVLALSIWMHLYISNSLIYSINSLMPINTYCTQNLLFWKCSLQWYIVHIRPQHPHNE